MAGEVEGEEAVEGGDALFGGHARDVGGGFDAEAGDAGVDEVAEEVSVVGGDLDDEGPGVEFFGGDVLFRGASLVGQSEHRISRLGIGRKFQTPRVYQNLTPRRNLELAVRGPHGPAALLFGSLSSDQRDRVQHLLGVVGLETHANQPAGGLSHGQKQWLEIAMLVAQDPELLLVDEPVAGLTDEETARTGELLCQLAGDHTVLVIEHDMDFIRDLQSPVTVLHEGHVLCEGSMDQVQNDPRVIEVYLGSETQEAA